MPGRYLRDIRYAFRVLAKSPGVTIAATLSLALGIGANTAIFSLIDAVILRPLPVKKAQQLVAVSTIIADDQNGDEAFSLPMFQEIQKRQQVSSSMLTYTGLGAMSNFEANGVRFPGSLDRVDGNYYSTLGVQPLLGRLINPADVAFNTGTSAQVAVITYRCWQTRYQGDPGVVGKTIRVDARPFMVIGVTPKEFTGLIIDGGSEVTVPIATPQATVFRGRNHLWLHPIGRLKPGVTLEEARAHLTALWPHILAATLPEDYDDARSARFFSRRIRIEPVATGISYLRERFSHPLAVLMGLVALVLLIACVNLANLMLGRAAARQHEIGIRVALGASGWQLTRQLLTESMILSIAGASLGLVLAISASRVIVKILWTGYVPVTLDPKADFRVLLFTAGAAVLTAVVFGLAPALRVIRADTAMVLREGSRGVHGGADLVRKLLVSGQIAISMVLVIGALLFTAALQKLRSTHSGFESGHLLTLQLIRQPGHLKISNRTAYYQRLIEELSRLPGVERVSYSYGAPVSRDEYKEEVSVRNSSLAPVQSVVDFIGPDFFRMVGMRVLVGREFDWRDDENRPRVVILSESLAERLSHAGNLIGQKMDLGPQPEHKGMTVVGVVNSASLWKPQSQKPLAVYLPALQEADYNDPMLVLRTAQDPATLKTSVQQVVESLGQHYPLRIQTFEERSDMFLTEQRITAGLSDFFGVLALLLASIGLYGLMSYAVTRRTSEIGVRMALGAETGNVVALVLREVMWLLLAGIAVGVPAALATSRLVSSMLFGMSPSDPVTIAYAVALLTGVAMLAGYLPARRASRIDPMTALRTE